MDITNTFEIQLDSLAIHHFQVETRNFLVYDLCLFLVRKDQNSLHNRRLQLKFKVVVLNHFCWYISLYNIKKKNHIL